MSSKRKYIILGVLALIILINPSEKSFYYYAKAHRLGQTTREYNFLLFSIFYANGDTDYAPRMGRSQGYYLGALGTFICIDDSPAPSIRHRQF